MFDSNKVFLGIAPIGWCNDDMPELGAENTFRQTVSEMALAGLVTAEELNKDYILPKAFDKRVGPTVAAAVAEAARRSGVARI